MATDLPTLVLEVAFSTSSAIGTVLTLDDPTRGKLNTGTLSSSSAATPVWSDISAYVRTGAVRRGSSRIDGPIISYEAGTLTASLRNEDRRFDPSNLDGPYVDGVTGTTQITAMVEVRCRALWDGVYYELFRGYADQWEVEWMGETYSECTLTATDAFKIFGNADRTAVGAVGGGEDSGARVSRILDSAGWPATSRIIATGDSTLQATTLEGTVMEELQAVSDSEIGDLYIDGGGRVVFNNRNAIVESVASNVSQATFGDGGGAELPYVGLELATDDLAFYNEVRLTRAGGTEQVADDATSQALYYVKTFSGGTDVLLETDAAALDAAHWILAVAADLGIRFTSITLNPRSSPTLLYPACLGLEMGERITVIRRPPGGGDPIELDQFIRGIQHDWAFDMTWTTTLALQDATQYGSFLVLNHASLGRLDYNDLSF